MSVPIRRPGARTPVFASGMVYLLSLTQASGASLYDQWKNGPPTSPDFFQSPSGGRTLPCTKKAEHIPTSATPRRPWA